MIIINNNIKFIRYLMVGIVTYGIDMGVFLLTFELLAIKPIIANVIGRVVAGMIAFFMHRHFTFKVASSAQRKHQLIMYVLFFLLNIPFSTVVLSIMLKFILLPVAAKFLSDVICVFINYWLSKTYVFHNQYTRL